MPVLNRLRIELGCALSIAASYYMRYLKILADDLTGAADTAARCRRFGLPATIFLDSPEMPLPQGALAFTSDSRHLAADAAAQSARKTAASLPPLDARWYKKIDSTLRGNVGSELDALLELVDAPAAVVCPAFPAQRRWLRNGILTAPDFGLPAIHLPSLLREQSRHPVAALSIEEVRGVALAARLKRLMRMGDSCTGQGRLVIAVDAITDNDLDRLVKAQEEALPDALLCGSAGLVGALVRREAAKETFPALPEGRIRTEGKTVLLVAGSGSEVAHRQIAHLLRCEDVNPQLGTSRLIVLPDAQKTAAHAASKALPFGKRCGCCRSFASLRVSSRPFADRCSLAESDATDLAITAAPTTTGRGPGWPGSTSAGRPSGPRRCGRAGPAPRRFVAARGW